MHSSGDVMATKIDQETRRVAIEVTNDRLAAWIRLGNPDDPNPLVPEEVVGALEEAGIVINDSVLQRINEFITLIAGEQDRPERFLVAEGYPAVEGRDGEFLWQESLKKLERDWQGDARVNYYTFNSINTVEKDQPIGTLVRSVPGTNGVDALGNTLTPNRRLEDVQLDSSKVRPSDDDSTTVLANCAGKVLYEKGRLSISEVFVVKKNVGTRVKVRQEWTHGYRSEGPVPQRIRTHPEAGLRQKWDQPGRR